VEDIRRLGWVEVRRAADTESGIAADVLDLACGRPQVQSRNLHEGVRQVYVPLLAFHRGTVDAVAVGLARSGVGADPFCRKCQGQLSVLIRQRRAYREGAVISGVASVQCNREGEAFAGLADRHRQAVESKAITRADVDRQSCCQREAGVGGVVEIGIGK